MEFHQCPLRYEGLAFSIISSYILILYLFLVTMVISSAIKVGWGIQTANTNCPSAQEPHNEVETKAE